MTREEMREKVARRGASHRTIERKIAALIVDTWDGVRSIEGRKRRHSPHQW